MAVAAKFGNPVLTHNLLQADPVYILEEKEKRKPRILNQGLIRESDTSSSLFLKVREYMA